MQSVLLSMAHPCCALTGVPSFAPTPSSISSSASPSFPSMTAACISPAMAASSLSPFVAPLVSVASSSDSPASSWILASRRSRWFRCRRSPVTPTPEKTQKTWRWCWLNSGERERHQQNILSESEAEDKRGEAGRAFLSSVERKD